MRKLFKKILNKIHWKLYSHYQKKARKYWYKIIGAKKYLPDKKMSKEIKAYFKNDKDTINSLYGKMCYADTDSVGSLDNTSLYPSVMRTGKFPLPDKYKEASDAEDKEWGTLEERGII